MYTYIHIYIYTYIEYTLYNDTFTIRTTEHLSISQQRYMINNIHETRIIINTSLMTGKHTQSYISKGI